MQQQQLIKSVQNMVNMEEKFTGIYFTIQNMWYFITTMTALLLAGIANFNCMLIRLTI